MNQNQNKPAPATSATPTAELTAATEPTPQIVENRDLAAAVPATADDAIRAALDLDGSDAERLALIRQIVETPVAANVRQIATATH